MVLIVEVIVKSGVGEVFAAVVALIAIMAVMWEGLWQWQ